MAAGSVNPLPVETHLWPQVAEKPSMHFWLRWKTTFRHQMSLLTVLNPSVSLSAKHWIMLFRQFFGDEGQRHFDAMHLIDKESIADVIVSFEQ